jgi:hypothetical protein
MACHVTEEYPQFLKAYQTIENFISRTELQLGTNSWLILPLRAGNCVVSPVRAHCMSAPIPAKRYTSALLNVTGRWRLIGKTVGGLAGRRLVARNAIRQLCGTH